MVSLPLDTSDRLRLSRPASNAPGYAARSVLAVRELRNAKHGFRLCRQGPGSAFAACNVVDYSYCRSLSNAVSNF